jgi:hypothetical protein
MRSFSYMVEEPMFYGGQSGWTWSFWLLLLGGLWKGPPMFGYQPFFGMSFFQVIWLLQMLQVYSPFLSTLLPLLHRTPSSSTTTFSIYGRCISSVAHCHFKGIRMIVCWVAFSNEPHVGLRIAM